MAVYKSDLQDIFFNLFDLLKIQDHVEGYGREDLGQILEEYDKFVKNEIYPVRREGDEVGVKLENGKVTVPPGFKKAKEQYYANGWFGLGYPEEIGGMPAPESIHVATSSLSCGCNVSFEMYPGLTRAALNVILEVGTEAQQQKFVSRIMEGSWGGTMCLTEPGAGSDVGAVTTTAEPVGDNKYKIRGTKIFISSGDNDLYDNIIHLVLARTPGSPDGTKGLSLFIVPKSTVADDGSVGGSNNVVCTKIEEKMGIHGSATCELQFGQGGDCIGEMIGKEHEGIINMFLMMNEARLMCGIQGESQGNMAYELTVQYAKERSQFGKEIIKHPDVKRLLMRMRSKSRGMRSLILYTGHLFDLLHAGQKEVEAEIALLTPICKSWCTDEGFNVAVDAVQVHGGYGFCSEYGIEQFVRDTKIASIYEGTNAIQALDFVTRKILKDKGAAFQALAGKIQASLERAEAKAWTTETAAMGNYLQTGAKILEKVGGWAASGKHHEMLECAHPFLDYSGNLIVAWRLLEAACLASQKLDSATGDDKLYYQSKIDDFRFFAHNVLSRNAGIAESILNFDSILESVEL